MSTTQQPEALRLADEAWNFDCSEYRGVRSANAAMMGKLQDCADMIRKLHAENTMLQAGYAAARLEIESLRARSAEPAGAQQPGAATWMPLPGALPEPGKPVLLDIGKKYPIRAMWAAKNTVQAADDDSDFGEYDEATDTYYCPEGWYEWNEHEDVHWRVDKTPVAWCELPPNGGASHGQAPAQTAPLPLLARDIAADFGVAPVQVCLALVELGFGHFSVNMAITPEMAEKLREHFTPTAQPAPAQAAPAAVAGPSDDDLPDVEDMAHSAVQEALSFGVSHDVFHRWMRAVMDKTIKAMAAPTTQPAPRLPERDASIPAEQQGLFRKFDVRRVDGTDKPGGKHHGCTYFVLDLDHDPCARPALAAYAAACEATHPALAADLRTKWGAVPADQPSPASQGDALSQAARDVLAERQRQVSAEGWTPEHDDEHDEGVLCYAAAGYAVVASDHIQSIATGIDGTLTMDDIVSPPYKSNPWPADWTFKPCPPRRALVKSGALILAELERIDRADAARAAQEGK